MFKNIEFEYTWCDYLTPCPHRENIEVGGFDCSECRYFISSRSESSRYNSGNDNYKKYTEVLKGVVFCAHPYNFNKN